MFASRSLVCEFRVPPTVLDPVLVVRVVVVSVSPPAVAEVVVLTVGFNVVVMTPSLLVLAEGSSFDVIVMVVVLLEVVVFNSPLSVGLVSSSTTIVDVGRRLGVVDSTVVLVSISSEIVPEDLTLVVGPVNGVLGVTLDAVSAFDVTVPTAVLVALVVVAVVIDVDSATAVGSVSVLVSLSVLLKLVVESATPVVCFVVVNVPISPFVLAGDSALVTTVVS